MIPAVTPTPRTLYVHDDLTVEVARAHGEGSEAARLARELLEHVGRAPGVVVLTLQAQLDALVAGGRHRPFALAVGIGGAGERVAHQVHTRTGWFPEVQRVELWREEDGAGGYRLSTPGGVPLAESLASVARAESIAVVDDTVFSGLTMAAVLDALPPGVLGRAQAFCLRAVAESLRAIAARCPIEAGFAAPGRLLTDVSFINASGLVRRGAIRRAHAPPLAFYERAEWMEAWFGGAAPEITARCRALAARLPASAAGLVDLRPGVA